MYPGRRDNLGRGELTFPTHFLLIAEKSRLQIHKYHQETTSRYVPHYIGQSERVKPYLPTRGVGRVSIQKGWIWNL